MLEKILSEANKLIVDSTGSWEEEFKKHVQRGHDLIAECLDKKDYKTASTMFGHLSRLGLEKTQVDVTSGGQPIQFQYVVAVPDALPGPADQQQLADNQARVEELSSPAEIAEPVEAQKGLQNETPGEVPGTSPGTLD